MGLRPQWSFQPAVLFLAVLLCSLAATAQNNAQSSSSSDSAKQPDVPSAPTPKIKPSTQPSSNSSGSGTVSPAAGDTKKDESPQDKFAFPEAISRKAAEAAAHQAGATQNASGKNATSGTGSNSSSSSSSSSSGDNAATSSANSALTLKDEGSNGDNRNPYRAADDDDVADFYYKNGNYMGAYMRYKDAIHYMPDDTRAQYGLAQLEEKFGQDQDAIKHYSEYLKLEPKGSKARDARKALKRLTEKTSSADSASKK